VFGSGDLAPTCPDEALPLLLLVEPFGNKLLEEGLIPLAPA
jgi:hypothetical protein